MFRLIQDMNFTNVTKIAHGVRNVQKKKNSSTHFFREFKTRTCDLYKNVIVFTY